MYISWTTPDHTADEEAHGWQWPAHWTVNLMSGLGILNCKRAARMRKSAPVNHTGRALPVRLVHSHHRMSSVPISDICEKYDISKTPRPEIRKIQLAPPDPTIPKAYKLQDILPSIFKNDKRRVGANNRLPTARTIAKNSLRAR